MFWTTVIPTIGRDSLGRAVDSVLAQAFDAAAYEVVVVNDSGRSLSPAAWQRCDRVRVINTNRRERSVARNTGAAVAGGRYLHFLDDDDWLVPGALAAFWALAGEAPEADWLYGGIRIVDNDGETVAEVNSGLEGDCFAPFLGGAWAPIQSSVVRADTFFAEGGFDPHFSVAEDLDLCRRVALRGHFANTPAVVACLRRDVAWETSTDYGRAAEKVRESRDRVLARPEAFSRWRATARNAYWHGRGVHAYAASVLFNLRRRRFADAASRAFFALVALALSGHRAFTAAFWRALRDDHPPDTLHHVQVQIEEGREQ